MSAALDWTPLSCAHADAPLPEPLPDELAALLTLRAETPVEARRVAVRIAFAGHLRRLDRPQLCALLRRSAIAGQLQLSRNCLETAKAWNLSQEPGAYTELGLTERVVAQHGADMAWTPAAGGWLLWDRRRWAADDGTAVQGLVKRTIRETVLKEARIVRESYAPDSAEAKAAGAFAKACQGAKTVRAAVELARSEHGVPVEADQWDAGPELLATASGTLELHLSGAVLRDHRRTDRITRITRAGYRPGQSHKESTWHRFVREVMPDPEVRAHVQRLAGYSLFGGNPERLLVILIGQSTTGKSTFVEALAHVLGDYGGSFDLSLFRGKSEEGPRADVVEALPRRFIQTTEASDRWRLHADAIKRMTGGDTLNGRPLYARKAVSRRPAFTPWIATNAAPQVINADDALWRRLAVVPFDTRIATEDPNLARRLREDEGDVVLSWAVQGWNDYARHGLAPVPLACQTAAARVRADLSLIDTWLADEVLVDSDAEARPEQLATAWQGWCVAMRVPERERISNITFARALDARGFTLGKAGPKERRYRVRRGLRLADPEQGTGSLAAAVE